MFLRKLLVFWASFGKSCYLSKKRSMNVLRLEAFQKKYLQKVIYLITDPKKGPGGKGVLGRPEVAGGVASVLLSKKKDRLEEFTA